MTDTSLNDAANIQHEERKDDSKEEVIEEVLPKTNLEPHTRVPYNNGYGDFCFGRWASRPTGSKSTSLPNDVQYWMKGSAGNVVSELNGFERSGPFPFFKLPNLIRNKIYRLLLGPLYSYSKSSKTSYIRLRTCKRRTSPNDIYDMGYDHYRLLENAWNIWTNTFGNNLAPFELQSQITSPAMFEILKAARNHEYASHPSREGDYELCLRPMRKLQKGTKDSEWGTQRRRDWLYLEWLRQVSNVSTEFRKELGDVFWARTAISYHNRLDYFSLPQILKQRPAVISGIKYLDVALTIWDQTPTFPKSMFPDFATMCKEWSSTLKLDKIHWRVLVANKAFREWENTKIEPLRAARSLNVTQDFNMAVVLCIIGRDPTEQEEALRVQILKTLTEMMMPDTLRPKHAESEMDIYLQSRDRTQSNAAPVGGMSHVVPKTPFPF
ncbi:hypothetical protein BDZ45DRAFT_719956 [Acephala macrosclerotiorum]|nr:hypothetical protein BDZ45DRAFT_719956 [Acephala macrosclerotiorum]